MKVTDAMVEKALMELRRHGIMLTREGTTQAVRAALEAALAVAPKDAPPDEDGDMPAFDEFAADRENYQP